MYAMHGMQEGGAQLGEERRALPYGRAALLQVQVSQMHKHCQCHEERPQSAWVQLWENHRDPLLHAPRAVHLQQNQEQPALEPGSRLQDGAMGPLGDAAADLVSLCVVNAFA